MDVYNAALKCIELIQPEVDLKERALKCVKEIANDMRSQLQLVGAPQFLTSSMTAQDLNITLAGRIDLKCSAELEKRIEETASLGQSELWSSANLYRHLNLLENHILRTNKASAHAWIDAFFFRVSAMLPENQQMILNMEYAAPPVNIIPSSSSTPSGIVDYIALVTNPFDAAMLVGLQELEIFQMHKLSTFFVVQTEHSNPSVKVPEAVCEIYMQGKNLQKKVLRGALTNGYNWIFLLIKLNNNHDGASYQRTDMLSVIPIQNFDGQRSIPQPWPDIIAAILSHWIQHSSECLGSDDFFEE